MTKKVEKTRQQLVEENNQLKGVISEKENTEKEIHKNISDALGMTYKAFKENPYYGRSACEVPSVPVYATWESILVRIGQYKESYDRDQKLIEIKEREKSVTLAEQRLHSDMLEKATNNHR